MGGFIIFYLESVLWAPFGEGSVGLITFFSAVGGAEYEDRYIYTD